jgi:UPF0755 protein
MIDELELAFDEREEKGRRRHRGTRRRKSGGRGKTVVSLLMAFVLLGVLGGAAWYGFDRVQGMFSAPDYDGGGTGEVTIEVKAGDTATEIGNTLVTAGVVKSAKAFINAAQENSLSQNIQPGFYIVRKEMSADTALSMLLDLKNKVSNRVTIPEGRSTKQVLKLLSEATEIPLAEFEQAAKDPIALGVPEFWFNRTDGKKAARSVEGFLYPDTYDLEPNVTAESLLEQMVQNFLGVAEEMKFVERVEAERGGVSPYEALIVASLAQAEAGIPEDLGKVARVAYNRVYTGDFDCGCLEMDVTVNYWLEANGKPTKASKDMTAAELNNPKNPYNRKLRGMIPSPINNPGKLAMEGAMDPPPGKWYYFVAIDKNGRSAFAETYQEQLRNEERAREAGVL